MSEHDTDDQVEVVSDAERQAEAEALQAAMAGYGNKEARAAMAPADDPAPEPQNVEPQTTPEHQPESTQAGTTEQSVAEQLAALKAEVQRMAANNGDPEAVRKMHGEIGNINRTLKQLQDAQPKPEPVKDELEMLLEEVDKSAEEFPEIAAKPAKAIKALASKIAQISSAPSIDPSEIDSRIAQAAAQLRQREAIETLAEEHPDYETVRDTPEFQAWRASKPADYQQKLDSTWNPLVVSRALTEFKESLKAKQKKQDRLESAVVTPSASPRAQPSTLSDEDAAWYGYNGGGKRQRK